MLWQNEYVLANEFITESDFFFCVCVELLLYKMYSVEHCSTYMCSWTMCGLKLSTHEPFQNDLIGLPMWVCKYAKSIPHYNSHTCACVFLLDLIWIRCFVKIYYHVKNCFSFSVVCSLSQNCFNIFIFFFFWLIICQSRLYKLSFPFLVCYSVK